jgi:anti-anti-sigma factor
MSMFSRNAAAVMPFDLVAARSATLAAQLDTSETMSRVQLAGELVGETVVGFTNAVRAALAPGCTDLRLDMKGVTFLDARGVSALIVAVRMAAEAGASLSLEQLQPLPLRVLGIVGLDALCAKP